MDGIYAFRPSKTASKRVGVFPLNKTAHRERCDAPERRTWLGCMELFGVEDCVGLCRARLQ